MPAYLFDNDNYIPLDIAYVSITQRPVRLTSDEVIKAYKDLYECLNDNSCFNIVISHFFSSPQFNISALVKDKPPADCMKVAYDVVSESRTILGNGAQLEHSIYLAVGETTIEGGDFDTFHGVHTDNIETAMRSLNAMKTLIRRINPLSFPSLTTLTIVTGSTQLDFVFNECMEIAIRNGLLDDHGFRIRVRNAIDCVRDWLNHDTQRQARERSNYGYITSGVTLTLTPLVLNAIEAVIIYIEDSDPIQNAPNNPLDSDQLFFLRRSLVHVANRINIRGRHLKMRDKRVLPAKGMGKSLSDTLDELHKKNETQVARYRTYYVHLLALSVPSLAIIYQVLAVMGDRGPLPVMFAAIGIGFHYYAMFVSMMLRLTVMRSSRPKSSEGIIRFIGRCLAWLPYLLTRPFVWIAELLVKAYEKKRDDSDATKYSDYRYQAKYGTEGSPVSEEERDEYVRHIERLFEADERPRITTGDRIKAVQIIESASSRVQHDKGVIATLLVYAFAIFCYAIASVVYFFSAAQ